MKVIGKRTKANIQKNVFTQQVVRVWNALPGVVVMAVTIVFERKLGMYLNRFCRVMEKVEEWD